MFNKRRKKKKKKPPLALTRRYAYAADLLKPKKRRYASEEQVTNAVIPALRARGWFCKKTHGNKFSKGWPDWYCIHPQHGHRWIELKSQRPDHWLEDSQVRFITVASQYGEKMWVLTGVGDIPLLHGPNNWRRYIRRK